MRPSTALMVERLRALAAEGKTYRQAAAKLGVDYTYIAGYARKYDIQFIRAKRGPKTNLTPGDREERMKALYLDGKTLEQIGAEYKITRERVRQLLTKYYGITAQAGGAAECGRRRRRNIAKRREIRYQKVLGCSYKQYLRIRSHPDRPTIAFSQQRSNARRRGIGWELTLYQWWNIWQKSGHWGERGRGRGYHMCRLNDVGPYSVDNVYVATGPENMRDHWVNRRASSARPEVSA